MSDKLQIGVIGSWRNNLPESSYLIAEEVGSEIANLGHVLITGGSTGIMEHAMKGCKKSNGISVGLVPATNWRKYDYLGQFIDIKIATGTDDAGRIPMLINSCDGVIAIGGGVGTLTEITNAYMQGKPVVVLENTGEVSDKIHKMLDEEGYIDTKKLVKIKFAKTAKAAIELLINDIKKGEAKDGYSFGPEHGKRV